MSTLSGKKAEKFVAWLAVIKGFLPKSMTIDEASKIFLRFWEDKEKEAKNHEAKKH